MGVRGEEGLFSTGHPQHFHSFSTAMPKWVEPADRGCCGELCPKTRVDSWMPWGWSQGAVASVGVTSARGSDRIDATAGETEGPGIQ